MTRVRERDGRGFRRRGVGGDIAAMAVANNVIDRYQW